MNKAGFTITAVTRSLGRLLLIALLAFSPAAWAITLQEAKQQGVVGEQRDGYLGVVNSAVSAEVQALIDQVNRERRERYQQIAQQNGISVAQVQARRRHHRGCRVALQGSRPVRGDGAEL